MHATANIPAVQPVPGCALSSDAGAAGFDTEFVFMRVAWLAPAVLALAMLSAGCAQNPYLLQRQVQAEQQQRLAMAQQAEELTRHVQTLDQDNRELQAMLAQSRQQTQ